MSQSVTQVFKGGHGELVSEQGPNILKDAGGAVVYSQWAYDGLGRKVLEKRPDGNGVSVAYVLCSVVACPVVSGVAPVYAITTTAVKAPIDLVAKSHGGANGPYSKVYYDSRDRPVRTETQGSDVSGTSTLVYQDTQYDALGRVRAKSAPYYANTPYAGGWTVYAYDNWGRVLTVTNPDNSKTTTQYSGLVTIVTNDLGQATQRVKDAKGQVVQVVDSNLRAMAMAYDPAGNLVRTTDSAGNVVTMHYDVRGRKKDLQDPDMGSWSYAYDALGNLIRQTDQKGQITAMSYDVLNRMTSKAENTQNSTWLYDTCPQGIGQLCKATVANGYSRQLSYDRLARISGEVVTYGGTPYTSSVDYDPTTGNVLRLKYPTAFTLQNVYSPLGFLKQVIDAGSRASYWQANSVDAQGHLVQQTYGNGVSTLNAFDALTGRLKSTVAGPSNTVQNIAYGYDTIGNLKTRADNLTGLSASYAYDNLNRLSSETRSGGGVPSAQVINWTYNDIGNIASRSDVGTYGYNASGAGSIRPHAVASIAGTVNGEGNPVYHYDNNGNLDSITASGGSHAIAWTSFNYVGSVSRTFGGHTNKLDYVYDPEYRRVSETYALPPDNSSMML